MKPHPKEKLNNKANKMIDLILDEIEKGGSKTIAAGFSDEKEKKSFILTVGLTVADIIDAPVTPEDVCENCPCNCHSSTPATEEETTDTEGE